MRRVYTAWNVHDVRARARSSGRERAKTERDAQLFLKAHALYLAGATLIFARRARTRGDTSAAKGFAGIGRA